MFHLRYWAGFWIWFDFQIYQSCEYTRVLNKIFYDKCLTVFWICLGFWIRQGSRDLRLHMVLNKIHHHRSWALFRICLEFWPWRCYTGFYRKQPFMFARVLSILRVLSMLGLEDTKAVNIPMSHMILCKLYFKDSWYFECLEFQIS